MELVAGDRLGTAPFSVIEDHGLVWTEGARKVDVWTGQKTVLTSMLVAEQSMWINKCFTASPLRSTIS